MEEESRVCFLFNYTKAGYAMNCTLVRYGCGTFVCWWAAFLSIPILSIRCAIDGGR